MNKSDLILNSNEYLDFLSFNWTDLTEDELSEVRATKVAVEELLTEIGQMPIKKRHICSGSFDFYGRYDLTGDTRLKLNILNKAFVINTFEDTKFQIKKILILCGINESDILHLTAEINILKDRIQFEFVFQTDNLQTDNLGISVETPALQVFGYTNFRKVMLRRTALMGEEINPECYNYPLYGFAIPYNLQIENLSDIMDNVVANAQDNGDLADMRALTSYSEIEINSLIDLFKAKKWQRIITPRNKFYLRSGVYVKF